MPICAKHEGLLDRIRTQRAADNVPQRALLRRQIVDVFREQVDLHTRRRAFLRLAAAMHRPVVDRLGHEVENLRVDLVRKHAVEFKMIKRLLDRARIVDRLRNECGEAVRRAAAVVTG
jgi:hypothetical protein